MLETTPCPWLQEPMLAFDPKSNAPVLTVLRPRSSPYATDLTPIQAPALLAQLLRTSSIAEWRGLLLRETQRHQQNEARNAGYLWCYYAPARKPDPAELEKAGVDYRMINRFILTKKPLPGTAMLQFDLIADCDHVLGWAFLEYWYAMYGPTIPIVLFKNEHQGIILHLNTYTGAPYVLHWFDSDGWIYHEASRNPAQTLAHHLRSGYTQPDNGQRFSDIADSERFLTGVARCEANHRQQQEQWEQHVQKETL